MKNLLLIIFIYFSFGVTSFDEQPFENSGGFNIIIPNVKAMEKEVKKLDNTIVQASILNKEVDNTLMELDSLNDRLSTPKEIRKYKREIRKDK